MNPDALGSTFQKFGVRKSRTIPDDSGNVGLSSAVSCGGERNRINSNNYRGDVQVMRRNDSEERVCPFFWDVPAKNASVGENKRLDT